MAKRRRSSIDPIADAAQIAQERATAEATRRASSEGPDLAVSSDRVRELESSDVVVITAAMNDSPLATDFWSSLNRYCNARGAQLVVIPLFYRNPTTQSEAAGQRGEYTWHQDTVPYLVGSRLKIHEHLWVMGDVPVQATALNPLSGLESLTRAASAIFGHAQVAMETVPTPQSELPKILQTTGACTLRNYSRSKAGRRAEFHHSIGATVVERDGEKFHMRSVLADSEGGFYDLDRYWHSKGTRRASRAQALITGDTHVDRVDPGVVEATYGPGGMVEVLRPEVLVWHDLLDFQSRSHHNDPIEQIALDRAGQGDVRAEMHRALDFLVRHTPAGIQSVVVPSNHNEHLGRWVREADWRRTSADNAELLLELQLACVRGATVTDAGVDQLDPLRHWFEQNYVTPDGVGVRFLERGESFRVRGVELGFHGDIGPNGARGSRRNLDRIGTRSIIGHSHSPGVFRGTYQVGTSSLLGLTYAKGGASSWLHTHGIIHPNGKRQLVHVIGGSWRSS